jgi:hypothetical protein
MPAWSDLWSRTTATIRRIAGFSRPSAAASQTPVARDVFVFIVTDDMIAAKSMLRTMALSWERFGSAHRKDGPEIVFRVEPGDGWGLDAFGFLQEKADGAARDEPLSFRAEGGEPHDREQKLDGSFELNFGALPDGAVIAKTNVVLRLIGPRYFESERVGAGTVAVLVRELVEKWRQRQVLRSPTDAGSASVRARSDAAEIDLVVMGITDALPRSAVQDAAVGSGIDRVLSPAMLPELTALSDIAPPKIAVVVTGLEREFARFNPRRGNGTKYACAQRAAWDPVLIKSMLAAVLEGRPHLLNLLRNDSEFRAASDPITVTAAMPCGFVSGLGFVNYNAWDPGWIVGGPWLREEKETPAVVPHHCADALITALTGRTTEFQLTTHDILSDQIARRRYGRRARG